MIRRQERRSQHGAGFRNDHRLGGRDHSTTSAAPALNVLLQRLANVHASSSGWRADCPCGHRSKGSLSIAASDSGAVLLHCFSGCTPHDVLGCFGLEVADLYPERIADPTPEARKSAREAFRRNAWSSVLSVLDRESTIVLIAARDLLVGHVLSAEDADRLAVAVDRIGRARAVLQ
jgi:hypothetical protein